MGEMTTVQLDKSIVESLKRIKKHPRQSYNELIAQLIEIFKKNRENSQYDEFLHKIQQPKMKELWDNKEDEEWENA